ncbi:MAG: chloride channel protein [Planctomycetota bacterium]
MSDHSHESLFSAFRQSMWQRLLGQDWYFIGLGAAIGLVTALGAIGFIELLHAAEHLMEHTYHAIPWWTLPLFPMVGALIAGLIIHYFAREAKGHGVPEVIDSVYRKGGQIRPQVAVAKALASVATIGSGGSAGAEGPIVQIGSALGSGIARLFRIPRDQVSTLLGCGAAAGIASVFNAPIAGVFFVMEILLRDFSLRTFSPILIASVMSAALTQAILGSNEAIFPVTEVLADYRFTIVELPSYVLLGFVCGVVAVAFIKALYKSEDIADKVRLHPIAKPVIGALMLGLLGLAYVNMSDRVAVAPAAQDDHVAAVMTDERAEDRHEVPPFFGNGYGTIRALLDPLSYETTGLRPVAIQKEPSVGIEPLEVDQLISTELWLLGLLLIAKMLATCLTLGSGGSGGVFAPSLFLGAVAGSAVGVTLQNAGLLPDDTSSPAPYALVGMAAVVAATTHAPLTAILILFELTRDHYVLLPIMLAAVVSTMTARLVQQDSIYSLKLRRRGVLLGTSADSTLLRRIAARDIQPVPHVEVRPNDPLSKLLELQDVYKIADFVVVDDDRRYLAMVTAQDVRTALIEREAIPYLVVHELMTSDLPTITPEETLDRVMEKFAKHEVSSLPLISTTGEGRVQGLITRARLIYRYQESLRERA